MKTSRRTLMKAGALGGAAAFAAPAIFQRFAGGSEAAAAEEWVPSTCWIGKQECGILARKIGGRVVKIEGHPHNPRNRGALCPKGLSQITALYDPYRVRGPLVRKNAKGQAGEWSQVSWDGALDRVAKEIRKVREEDPKLFVWQKGRSKAKPFYDEAFVKATGATKLHHGAFCSDAGYRAAEYTVGYHGVLHPDFRHTRYMLSWGWNLRSAGGNKFCWITWPRQFLAARERGMKIVSLDPRLDSVGPHVDRWLPIRPGTDLAFFLALANVLIDKGFVDRPYLTNHTNSPFLVDANGDFVRAEGKDLIWCQERGAAVPFDEPGTRPALEGRFVHDGAEVRPAFQVYREHVAHYTPKWAEDLCGLPAAEIERVAVELGREACIGSTIRIEGKELPYRPVGIMGYHVTQQELGFQACRQAILVYMLLGAIDAVGGVRIDFTAKENKNWKALDEIQIQDPPYGLYLDRSKYFPINSNNSSIVAHVINDPGSWGVEKRPRAMLIHMANPVIAFADQKHVMEALARIPFVAVIDPWLSETADLYADVVLPASTLEKYEGPMGVTDQYEDATSLRLPLMDPIFDSRGEIDIYLDLTRRLGILEGKGGYLDQLNKALKLEGDKALPIDARPTSRSIFDHWSKVSGYEGGLAYFEKHGVSAAKPVSAAKYYGYAQDPPFEGRRHRLYGESLLRYQRTMREKGVEEVFWRQYTALPTWMRQTMDRVSSDYDLTLISYKMIEFKQSRSTFMPFLNELAPRQGIRMNPAAARARGIEEGDEVVVESKNAVTGETRQVRTLAVLTEGIRPDTVAMPHHYGFSVHPFVKGCGPTPNALFFSGPGYVSNTADQSFQVKVKVFRA